jgi:hypothetical protein
MQLQRVCHLLLIDELFLILSENPVIVRETENLSTKTYEDFWNEFQVPDPLMINFTRVCASYNRVINPRNLTTAFRNVLYSLS